jgi:hypothetical protein
VLLVVLKNPPSFIRVIFFINLLLLYTHTLSLTERSAVADVSAELAGSTWTCRSLLWADDCFALDPELVECCLLEGLSLCCDLVLES